jgi:hypothetical protein
LIDADLDGPAATEDLNSAESTWLGKVLNALYGMSFERILARRDPSVDVDDLVLRAWDQQWPRLRRTFRFCTLTTKDRSTDNAVFDLQVAPGLESGSRTRVPGTFEAQDLPLSLAGPWLGSLVIDIQKPNASGLRDLLRLLGADILGGREAMQSLCEFHHLTRSAPVPESIEYAASFIEGRTSLVPSRQARSYVAKLALEHVSELSEESTRFLIEHLSLLNTTELNGKLREIGSSIWRTKPGMLLSMFDREDTAEFAERFLQDLPADDIVSKWSQIDNYSDLVLQRRPDLLRMPTFWSITKVAPSSIAATGIDLSDELIADAMLRGLCDAEAIASGEEVLGSYNVLEAIQRLQKLQFDNEAVDKWLELACRNPPVIAKFLSECARPSGVLLSLISEKIAPDVVPNDYGQDPWFHALSRLREHEGLLPIRLCAYGFGRALGRRSRTVEGLLQLTFEPLHEFVGCSDLDKSSWDLFEGRLPWISASNGTDPCLRIRRAVAKAFLDRYLWAKGFAWVAVSDSTFELLMYEVLDLLGGRRFLREVKDSLRYEKDDFSIARRNFIGEFLKSNERSW